MKPSAPTARPKVGRSKAARSKATRRKPTIDVQELLEALLTAMSDTELAAMPRPSFAPSADDLMELAGRATSLARRRALFTQGMTAGRREIGKQNFKQLQGEFWGWLETRPYMRARSGLAHTLMQMGEVDAAIGHFREMLRLNPNDNQGVRWTLLGCLMRQGATGPVEELLAAYEDDDSVHWVYGRVLLAFQAGAQDSRRMAMVLKNALRVNAHVPAILAGTTPPVRSPGGYITVGGADEATCYAGECGDLLRATPGAVEWLVQVSAGLRTSKSPKLRLPP